MSINDIKQRAYELYKLDWMASHGYTLRDLAVELMDLVSESNCADTDQLISEFEMHGFFSGGDIYACYDEFLVNEYQDIEYMKRLLSEEDFRLYLEDIKWKESIDPAVQTLRRNAQKEYVEWEENALKYATPYEKLVYTYVHRAIREGKLDKYASGFSTITKPIEHLYEEIQCAPDFYYSTTVDFIEYYLEGKETE